MKKTRILITGASGFIGRNTAEYFRSLSGYEVFACTDEAADLRDEAAVAKLMSQFVPAAVVHCAALGGTRKTGYDAGSSDVVADNLRMFFNLARCLKPGMRMIHIGSGAEYDRRAYKPKMKEDYFDVNVPADAYGFSKYAISKLIGNNKNIICLRLFGIYGKYEDYTFKFISNAIVKNLLGLPIVISQNVVFDFLYIDDFCKMLRKLLEIKPADSHYNLTPTESIDLVSLAEIINSVSKSQSVIKVLNPGLNVEYTGSNRRILKELGGFNFTSYESGVKQLYAYYASRLKELDLETVKKDPFLKLCKNSGGGQANKKVKKRI